jgi:hypothetical protein
MTFECHITITPGPLKLVDIQQIVQDQGWKFSCIQGDPDLGDSSFCYATRWFDDKQHAITTTHMFKDRFEKLNLTIVRVKVEQVVHDSRIVNGQWKEIR